MNVDVAIIGAGPAGSVAGAILAARGHSVCVVESAQFPRFSIGESLLPQAMEFLAAANLLADVEAANFQQKDGAVFRCGHEERVIDFAEKSTPGWATTYQVERARFDDILANGARRMGADIRFDVKVTAFTPGDDGVSMRLRDSSGKESEIRARFALDASGFGRVLARLIGLDRPSTFEERQSLFTHLLDNIPAHEFDRRKILISIHPKNASIWYWLIPLTNGVSSVGVVGRASDIEGSGDTNDGQLENLIGASGRMADLLADAQPIRPVGKITGYACGVSSLHGPGYALLGNAAEFLDPVFSSGVTIALKSSVLASDLLDRQLRGGSVDWQHEFVEPLYTGIEAFRAFVDAWYDGSLQRIILRKSMVDSRVKGMVVSVLAGYAWDHSNPFVRHPKRYLAMVDEL